MPRIPGASIMPRGCRVGYVQQDLDEAVLDTPLLEWVVDVLPDWHDFWSAWEAAAASQGRGRDRAPWCAAGRA